MAIWGRGKKDEGPQRCFAEDLKDRTVSEYNQERHRARRFFESYHGIPGVRAAQFKILCEKCLHPVEFGDINGSAAPPPQQQVICPKCGKTDYLV